MAKMAKITSSSTAEYFSKNLQQVGFSSPTKAVLTVLKEAIDNSLDACEEAGILPEIAVEIKKTGAGSLKNTDELKVTVRDNGPGIDPDDLSKVFGEYLASSKFGRGRCMRGQQGIGISAATTWAQQTSTRGALVITKQKGMRKAIRAEIEVDIRNNKGRIKDKDSVDWEVPHGTQVEFSFAGRAQLNGEAGLLNYLRGTALVNPHLKMSFKLLDDSPEVLERVFDKMPEIPEATEPHPHTMKMGEFIEHARLFGKIKTASWLTSSFSRVSDAILKDLIAKKVWSKSLLEKPLTGVSPEEFRVLYEGLQNSELKAPSTASVLSIGEEAIAKSIKRLGDVDFFAVVERKPAICDFKPVQVEVAMARLIQKGIDQDDPVQVLRFANRVPLQFDKAACAIVKAITSVNWKVYGLRQPKDALPQGPYIVAVSVVSPFIKFKNASKETIDASDELVEEIRRTLMQCGQKLSRYIRKEAKAAELEEKLQHIEQFGPILVEGLCRITSAPEKRKLKAIDGLRKILGRDADKAHDELSDAHQKLASKELKDKKNSGTSEEEGEEVDNGKADEK